jgi:hypothetical protein
VAHSTSQTPFVTVNKSFTWRGAREIWSNGYHLDSTPPTSADWNDLWLAIWQRESVFLPPDVQLESGTGHTPGTPPVLVWEQDAAPVGEGGPPAQFVPTAAHYLSPGDVAGWVRWGTDLKNSRGKPVYLRNYYHAVYVGADGNTIDPLQHAGMLDLGAAFQNGITVLGRTYRRTGPNHGTPQNHAVSTYATTRTLERRGKRKKPATELQLMGPSSDSFFKWFLGKLPALVP